MTRPPRTLPGTTIVRDVNTDAIRAGLATDPAVKQIIKQGQILLDQTNRPNVITLQQFEPFLPMFNMDVERYDAERPMGPYIMEMNKLFNRWKNDLGINLYEITVVIKSKEDPTVLLYLDRRFTRIRPDNVEGVSARDNIPGNISKTSDTTRVQELLKASVHDIAVANGDPDQMDYFARVRIQSALINKKFVEEHMSPEKRAALLGSLGVDPKATPAQVSTEDAVITFADDDDDD